MHVLSMYVSKNIGVLCGWTRLFSRADESFLDGLGRTDSFVDRAM